MDRSLFSFVVRIKTTPVHRKLVKQTVVGISSQVFFFRKKIKPQPSPDTPLYIWPIRRCTDIQGIDFDLFVLNRVYNFVSVCQPARLIN